MLGFHELYERHAGDVHRFALFLTGNPAFADDLVSETFVRAWTARGSIRDVTVRAYLLTITRNLWRDMQRKERRLVPLEEAGEPSVAARGDHLADLGWASGSCNRLPPAIATRCCCTRATGCRTRKWRGASTSARAP